jgi:predicted ATPase
VIVLEDLHWSDDASLSLLDFLGRELERAPVFVVGTYRDVDVAAHGPLARLLNRTASMAMRLPLGPLDPAGVGALVRQLSDSEPSVQLATDLHRRTGGNPLFVREVVRLAQAQGASLTDHVVPAGVRAVIERRVARLPQATHELLATAAVIGLEFEVEMLADLGAISTAQARETLGAAVSARLVNESLVHGQYSFSHALLRDAVYEGLHAEARTSLHRRAAAFIEQGHHTDVGPRLAEVAHHLGRSVAPETRDHAIDVTLSAARQAQSMLAYEDAARWYQQALALLTPADSDRRLTILLELGEVEVAGPVPPDIRGCGRDCTSNRPPRGVCACGTRARRRARGVRGPAPRSPPDRVARRGAAGAPRD